jgi:hypothetical protein
VLRAAVAGGAAYRMGKKRAARPGEQPQEETAGSSPEPAGRTTAGGMSAADMGRLKELAQLHDQGALTDEEFEQQKQVLLGSGQ